VLGGDLQEGYYLEPTILFGQNNMRVFQEEIFGPVLAVTTFKTMEEALEIANDTPYGLGRASGAATVIWPIKWARHSGRARLDQLLSRLSGTRGIWRL
jgi:hypothetical protein